MPEVPAGTPPGVPDEDDFDRQLRELIEGSGPRVRYREASAAERARRAARAGARPGWPEESPGQTLRRHRTTLAVVLSILVLAGATGLWSWLARQPSGSRAAAGTSVAAGTNVTAGAGVTASATAAPDPSASLPPTESLGPAIPATDPFRGTEAAAFASGTAGIAAPTARAVGPYSAAQVRAAYGATSRLLIAAALDPEILKSGPPTAFASQLPATERSYFLDRLNLTGLDHGRLRSTRSWVASFAPGSDLLARSVIKVHGQLTARTARAAGRRVLQIHASYLFVYPVTPAGRPAALRLVWLQITADADFARWDAPRGSAPPGGALPGGAGGGRLEPFWTDVSGGAAGVQCAITDGFLHPLFGETSVSPAPGAAPAGGSPCAAGPPDAPRPR